MNNEQTVVSIDVEYQFLRNNSRFNFLQMLNHCIGNKTQAQKIVIVDPYIKTDYQMLGLASCLEALFSIAAANCTFILHTIQRPLTAFDNCDPYNPVNSSSRNAIDIYKHIFDTAWNKINRHSSINKPRMMEVFTGKDVHDRSITILADCKLYRYDLGHGLDFLLDCGCIRRDPFEGNNVLRQGRSRNSSRDPLEGSNVLHQGRSRTRSRDTYPERHFKRDCGIFKNRMSDVEFSKHPTRKCQIIKTILTVNRTDVAIQIFKELQSYTEPVSYFTASSFFNLTEVPSKIYQLPVDQSNRTLISVQSTSAYKGKGASRKVTREGLSKTSRRK